MGELKKIKHDVTDKSDWYSFGVIFPVGLSCLLVLEIPYLDSLAGEKFQLLVLLLLV